MSSPASTTFAAAAVPAAALPAATTAAPAPAAALLAPPTYDDLKAALRSSPSSKETTRATMVSLVGKWMDFHKIPSGTPLGQDFLDHKKFLAAAAEFLEARRKAGLVASTKSDRSRLVGPIQKQAALLEQYYQTALGAGTLAERITALHKQGKLTKACLQQAGIPHTTAHSWRHGERIPSSPEARASLTKLETILQTPPGFLTGTLPEVPTWSMFASPDVRRQLDYSAFASFVRQALDRIGQAGWSLWIALNEALKRAAPDGVTPGTVSHGRVAGWLNRGEQYPGRKAREEVLPALATVLDVPLQDLLARLPKLSPNQFPFKHTQVQWSASLKAEWADFVEHKTLASHDPPAMNHWRIRQGGTIPSALLVREFFAGYMGWLSAQSAACAATSKDGDFGITAALYTPPDQLCFADLARRDEDGRPLIRRYVEWHARRMGVKQFTRTHSMGLVFAQMVLHPAPERGVNQKKAGYLWWGYTPYKGTLAFLGDVAARGILPISVGTGTEWRAPTLDEWRAHCEKLYYELTAYEVDVKKQSKPNEARAHVQAILDMDRPWKALKLMTDRLEGDIVLAPKMGWTPARIAPLKRDHVFLLCLRDAPMRREQWARLTHRADGTGHLQRVSGKPYDWKIVIPQHELKNPEPGGAPYEVMLRRELTPYIDDYIATWRPLLKGGTDVKNHFFFLSTESSSPGQRARQTGEGGMTDATLSARVLALSERYLPEYLRKNRGFRAHAMRHIIATHWVKLLGEAGVIVAAEILNDDPLTVRAHYGFLLKREQGERLLARIEAGYAELEAEDSTATTGATS